MLLSRTWFPVHTTPYCPAVTWSTASLFTSTYRNCQGLPPSLFSVWTDTSWKPRKRGDKHPDINIVQYLTSMLYEHSELLSHFTISDSCSFTETAGISVAQDLMPKPSHRKPEKGKFSDLGTETVATLTRIRSKLWERKDKLWEDGSSFPPAVPVLWTNSTQACWLQHVKEAVSWFHMGLAVPSAQENNTWKIPVKNEFH